MVITKHQIQMSISKSHSKVALGSNLEQGSFYIGHVGVVMILRKIIVTITEMSVITLQLKQKRAF